MTGRFRLILPFYLFSFVCANLLVRQFGAYGLWFSSFFLIPFDFICRCIFHEKWKGSKLILNLFILTCISGLITYFINRNTVHIAIGSVFGFTAAQIGAGIYYQLNKKRSWFAKVNGSDLVAIMFDSIVFQFVVFGSINPLVTIGQIVIKFTGGLVWYWILFHRIKIQDKL